MKSVEMFLYEDACGLDVMGPLEVLSHATLMLQRDGKPEQGYEVVFSAEKPGPVLLGSGISVIANQPLASKTASDYFIVPGTIDPSHITSNATLMRAIKEKISNSHRNVSVCTGAFILAKAGLLDNKRCTTHWVFTDQLAEQYPTTQVLPDAIYVEDGNVFTSAGITAGIDLALALVERDYGAKLATQVAQNLVLYLRRPGNQSQFSTPMELRSKAGDRFSQLHDWILENIERPLNVESLADCMAMSPRNFARLFAQETGITPGRYIELMRVEKARELLTTTSQPINQIAGISGFQREERMRRVFIKILGITPSQYRYHFSADINNPLSKPA